jgi:hypothetical protein
MALALVCMWVVDPTKIARLSGRAMDDLAMRAVDGGYRLVVLLSFGVVLGQLARARSADGR